MGDDGTFARNRALWSRVNDAFTDGAAEQRWQQPGIRWGLFQRAESEVGALGVVAGLDVLEVGCGTAFFGAALARAGARVVAVDLSHDQLVTARRCQDRIGPVFPLLEAAGEALPVAGGRFDLVVSEYGMAPWCEPASALREVARVLRPGGRLVFLTNSVLAALCVPAEGGPAGDRLLRAVEELDPVPWPGGGLEHHPGHGRWISLLQTAGFQVEALHELTPPDASDDPDWYEIVTADWARRWPAEDLWVARLSAPGTG